MKTVFLASLCREGIRGGILIMDDTSVTWRTGTYTILEKYRRFRIGFEDIEQIETGRKFFLFPTVTFILKKEETLKYIVFGRNRFLNLLWVRKEQWGKKQK